jgi:hypothetical protein
MSKHGELTAEIGSKITLDGYDVFYDHGISSENVGKIVSTLKREYGRDDELSQLDIAVVEQGSDKAVLLVEIEETSDRPKTFLGDIFGVLFGKHIYFRRRELQVGNFTTLLVVGISKAEHIDRNQHIQDYANSIKVSLGTQNSKIGKVVIKTYRDKEDMLEKLPTLLEMAINGEL